MKQVILLIVTCALLSSCNEHKENHHKEVKHLVTSPIQLDTTITKDYVSQIHSIRHIELRALERGYLQHIAVDEGQLVRKGQLMFQVMPNVYQAELLKAEAEAEAVGIEYNNTKLLVDNKIVFF